MRVERVDECDVVDVQFIRADADNRAWYWLILVSFLYVLLCTILIMQLFDFKSILPLADDIVIKFVQDRGSSQFWSGEIRKRREIDLVNDCSSDIESQCDKNTAPERENQCLHPRLYILSEMEEGEGKQIGRCGPYRDGSSQGAGSATMRGPTQPCKGKKAKVDVIEQTDRGV